MVDFPETGIVISAAPTEASSHKPFTDLSDSFKRVLGLADITSLTFPVDPSWPYLPYAEWKHGIKLGAMDQSSSSDEERLRRLEDANSRLRGLVADQALEISGLRKPRSKKR